MKSRAGSHRRWKSFEESTQCPNCYRWVNKSATAQEQRRAGKFCRSYTYYNRGYDWTTAQKMAERAVEREDERLSPRSKSSLREDPVRLTEPPKQKVPEPKRSPPRAHGARRAVRHRRRRVSDSRDRTRSSRRRADSRSRTHREDHKQKLESKLDSALAKYPPRTRDGRSAEDSRRKTSRSSKPSQTVCLQKQTESGDCKVFYWD